MADQLSLDEILTLANNVTDVHREESEFRKGSDKKVITYRARSENLYLTVLSHPYPGHDSMYEVSVLLGTCKVAEHVLLYDGKTPNKVLDVCKILESKYVPSDRETALIKAREILQKL